MDVATRSTVRERAEDRCEYCRLRQEHEPGLPFHIEHITAKQHRGGDDLSNLALACRSCNSHKGTNLSSMDPDTNLPTPLFHPRRHVWAEHFCIEGIRIRGITDIGRTTVWLLEMNDEDRQELRTFLQEAGEWP